MPAESHILDGLSVADGVGFVLADTPSFVPAAVRTEWVGGIDSDGSIPVEAGASDNAVLTLPLRVVKQATADLAWGRIGAVLDKLEAVRRSSGGLTHVWTPKDMTDSWELTVRSVEIAEFPMNDRDSLMGYLRRFPRITVVLQCDPFMYREGEVIDYAEVTSSEPVFSIVLANVPGHVDAEATVTVTDAATQARRHVEGGLGDNSAASLLIDSASLVITVGTFAATATTRTGAYSSNGVVRASLALQPQAVCGTGNLTHVGVLRPKSRVWATSTGVRLRLAYRVGDGAYSFTPWVAPHVINDFCEVSFGTIALREVTAGAQQWDGRIEAYSDVITDTLDIDYFAPLPAARHWSAAAAYKYQPGLLVARDEFYGRTAGNAITVASAPLGGAWSTTGSTTDFTVAHDIPAFDDESVTRATVSDSVPGRVAFLAAVSTSGETGVRLWVPSSAVAMSGGVIARYTDINNFLRGYITSTGSAAKLFQLMLQRVVAGVFTTMTWTAPEALPGGAWYRLRLIVNTAGHATLSLLDINGATLQTITGSHSTLATGGALASGKTGIFDHNASASAVSRYYRDFYVSSLAPEPIIINSGRSIQFRHDWAERESSDGLTYGTVTPSGGRAFVPCAGDEGRVTRLWTKARRNDIEVAADSSIADSTKLKVSLRPRYRMPTS